MRNARSGDSVPEHIVATRSLRPLRRSTTRARWSARETKSSNIFGMEDIGGRSDWSAAARRDVGFEVVAMVEDGFRDAAGRRGFFLSTTMMGFLSTILGFFLGRGSPDSSSSKDSKSSSELSRGEVASGMGYASTSFPLDWLPFVV
jgi:hypothetical protein